MKGENGVLLVALLLIVAVGFIGVNYGKITGGVVRQGQKSIIEVAPTVIDAGGEIEITVIGVCNKGLNCVLSGRDSQGNRVFQKKLNCNFARTGEVITGRYKTSSNTEPGTYFITGEDGCSGGTIKSNNYVVRPS